MDDDLRHQNGPQISDLTPDFVFFGDPDISPSTMKLPLFQMVFGIAGELDGS
jgi:hypothetical protein